MNLDPSLDHILRIGKEFTAQSSYWSHQHRLEKIQMLLIFPREMILQELIGSELKGIRRHLSQHGRYHPMIHSSYSIITIYMLQTLSRIFEQMIAVDLHLTLDQLHWRHYKGNQKPCKSSILKAIPIAKLSLVPDGLIHLIGAEDKSMDDGICNERIVDSTEELHEALMFYDVGYGLHHS